MCTAGEAVFTRPGGLTPSKDFVPDSQAEEISGNTSYEEDNSSIESDLQKIGDRVRRLLKALPPLKSATLSKLGKFRNTQRIVSQSILPY